MKAEILCVAVTYFSGIFVLPAQQLLLDEKSNNVCVVWDESLLINKKVGRKKGGREAKPTC